MTDPFPRARQIAAHARAAGMPLLKQMVGFQVSGTLSGRTWLAVCPNSEAVTRAALRAARTADAPLLFAATLNQVDVDGGYTGWTPASFVAFVAAEAARLDVDVPVLPCLDHGGPWLKDAHTRDHLDLDATMEAVKASLEACLRAGYALLHVDPTVDRRLPVDAPLPVERVVARTVELMAHAEAFRRAHALPPVAYEVGTEEVQGGLADPAAFAHFLRLLDTRLREAGLHEAWPCFVVGKVGTDLHTTHFDPAVAQALTTEARRYGALVKGHYTDYVANPEAYPRSGMGAANVGPEFTEVEYRTLLRLAAQARALGYDAGLERALFEAVEASGRWQKWLLPEEQGKGLDALTPPRRAWIVGTSSRYVWTDARVQAARHQLYHDLAAVCDADACVLDAIEAAILRYYDAFNLRGTTDRLLRAQQAYP